MKSNFDRAMAHVFKSEGGYVNHPHDPGGETNFGISKRSYPNEDIRNLTKERAAYLYRRDYWNPVNGDNLPAGLDLVAFDAAVNSGISRGAKWLQQALGVPADGRIGDKTIAAAKAADAERVIDGALALRIAFLKRLPHWNTFGRGWQRRIDSVRAEALDMASQSFDPAVTKKQPNLFQVILELLKRMFGK